MLRICPIFANLVEKVADGGGVGIGCPRSRKGDDGRDTATLSECHEGIEQEATRRHLRDRLAVRCATGQRRQDRLVLERV